MKENCTYMHVYVYVCGSGQCIYTYKYKENSLPDDDNLIILCNICMKTFVSFFTTKDIFYC